MANTVTTTSTEQRETEHFKENKEKLVEGLPKLAVKETIKEKDQAVGNHWAQWPNWKKERSEEMKKKAEIKNLGKYPRTCHMAEHSKAT